MAGFIDVEQPVQSALGRDESFIEQGGSLFSRGRFHRQQLGADGRGQLFNYVLPAGDKLGALFDQLVWSEAGGLGGVAWNAKDFAAKLHASRAVIKDPEYCAPSTTTTPSAIPAMIRLRIGKF